MDPPVHVDREGVAGGDITQGAVRTYRPRRRSWMGRRPAAQDKHRDLPAEAVVTQAELHDSGELATQIRDSLGTPVSACHQRWRDPDAEDPLIQEVADRLGELAYRLRHQRQGRDEAPVNE